MLRFQTVRDYSGSLASPKVTVVRHALRIRCRYGHLNVTERLGFLLCARCFHTIICSVPSLLYHSVLYGCICWFCTNCGVITGETALKEVLLLILPDIIVARAGLSKCGARLETILRGPTQWRVQKIVRSIKSYW